MEEQLYAEQTKYEKIYQPSYWGCFRGKVDETIIKNRNLFVEKYFIKKNCRYKMKEYIKTFFHHIRQRIKAEGAMIDHIEHYNTGYSIIEIISVYVDEGNEKIFEKFGYNEINPMYAKDQRTFMYEYYYEDINVQKLFQDCSPSVS